jgi:hypothetical protein
VSVNVIHIRATNLFILKTSVNVVYIQLKTAIAMVVVIVFVTDIKTEFVSVKWDVTFVIVIKKLVIVILIVIVTIFVNVSVIVI